MLDKEYHLMAMQQAQNWWYSTKREYLDAVLSQLTLPSNAHILELGSGVGANFPVLRKYGMVKGVEQSEVGATLSKERFSEPVVIADLNTYVPDKDLYDVICILDVLYHQYITDDLRIIQNAVYGLKPGGYLLITDCAHQWLFGPHDVNNMARQRYSLPELSQKVEQAGVKIIRKSYLFAAMFPLFVLARIYQQLTGHCNDDQQSTGHLNDLLSWIGQKEAQVLKKQALPFGSSILILAQKK